jgi:hypothetical protein
MHQLMHLNRPIGLLNVGVRGAQGARQPCANLRKVSSYQAAEYMQDRKFATVHAQGKGKEQLFQFWNKLTVNTRAKIGTSER